MIYFISDVHLGVQERTEDKKREDLLLAFLDKIENDCEHLIIAGDLFDYWFEYKYVIPKFFFRTLAKLYEIRKKGISIDYLMGNHDFGHLKFFSEELNIPIYENDISRDFDGRKFYISHGDGKAYNDRGYRVIKKIMRNPLSLRLFLKLHPDCGIASASGSSRKSRSYTDSKNFGAREGLDDFARDKIEKEGYDYIIMGHRHIAKEIAYKGGKYINLGEWVRNPAYAIFDGTDLNLRFVKELLAGDNSRH